MAHKSKGDKDVVCCIHPAQGIKIIGVISCISGSIITFITWILFYVQEDGPNGTNDMKFLEAPVATNLSLLLVVGFCQTSSSIWLLLAHDKRKPAKVWAIFHIFSAIATVLFLWSLFVSSTSEINHFVQTFFSFIGINLCFITFDTLVMIEFLIRPPTEDTFRHISYHSNMRSIYDNRDRREFKV